MIANSFAPAMIKITPSNAPTAAIEVTSNRRTISETNNQATPVTRNSHQGSIEAPRTRMLIGSTSLDPADTGRTSHRVSLSTCAPPVMVRNG